MAKIFKMWIYHSTKEPKIITSDELKSYQDDGWSDTPATFAKIKDFGIDENNPASVQVLGEAISGVADRLNGELNLDTMKKAELEEYALKHFEVDLDKRKSLKALRAQVRQLLSE